MLDEAGIANAVEVAHDAVTRAKTDAILTSLDFTEAAEGSISAFENEMLTLGYTENAVSQLSVMYQKAQKAMSEILSESVKQRLKDLNIELTGIKTVADAYNSLINSGEYTRGEASRARQRVAEGKGSGVEKAVFGIAQAQEDLDKLIDNLSSPTIPSFKPSDSSSKSAANTKI